MSSTTAPCPSTRRDQSRLKACRHSPMRVPPSQSSASLPGGGERRVHVAPAQVAGDVGQPRAEGEGVHLRPARALGVGGGVQEVQQHPAVVRHRPRDVAERDEVRPAGAPRARAPAPRTSPPERSAARMVPRQSATRPRGSARVRRLAIGRTGSSSRAMARRAAACSAADICAKSMRLQPLVGREGEPSRRSRPRRPPPPRAARRRLGAVEQRLGGAPLGRPAAPAARSTPRTMRREQRHHVLHELRVAPEEPEDLGEDLAVLRAADEAGLQREVEVAPVGEARRLDRADRVEHPPGADRQPGLAQRPGEVGDVRGELAVLRERSAAQRPCA